MAHGGHGGHDSDNADSEIKHTDPVCGMDVKMDQGYGKMHEGKLYRFCSRKCLDQFDADPEKYLQQVAESTGGGS